MINVINNNAPRVENENVNVVINQSEANAAALQPSTLDAEAAAKKAEAEAKKREDSRKKAEDVFSSARDALNAAREDEDAAKLDAARARVEAGRADEKDAEALQLDVLKRFAASILENALLKRADIEAKPETKAARKTLRNVLKETSLSRALRDIVNALDVFNGYLSAYQITLDAAALQPSIMKDVSPFLKAPTPDGARVALLAQKYVRPVESWTPEKVCDILIYDKLIKAAAAAAPRAAVEKYVEARRALQKAEKEANARRARVEEAEAAAKICRESGKATPADIEARDAITEEARAKMKKAEADNAAALDARNAALDVACNVGGATLDALQKVDAAADIEARAAIQLSDALNVQITNEKRVSFVEKAATKAKKKAADARAKKADNAAALKAESDNAAAALKEAKAKKREADNALKNAKKAADAAREALNAAITNAAALDVSAKYAELLDAACNAMKARRDAEARAKDARKKAKAAKAKKDEAAKKPEADVSNDALFQLQSDAADAEAEAARARAAAEKLKKDEAAALDALNNEADAADIQRNAREAAAA